MQKKLLSFHIKQTFLTEMLYSDIFSNLFFSFHELIMTIISRNFFNVNLQSLAILPSLTSKINVPIITVCNKQRRIFTVIMIWKKWICSTCYLKITYSFTSGGFPHDRSVSTSGMQINTKPNWKTNNEIRQINTTNWFIQQIDVQCYWKQVGLLPTTELYAISTLQSKVRFGQNFFQHGWVY